MLFRQICGNNIYNCHHCVYEELYFNLTEVGGKFEYVVCLGKCYYVCQTDK